jgi:hypothetical protein
MGQSKNKRGASEGEANEMKTTFTPQRRFNLLRQSINNDVM